jgi:site-specific DNA-methyltransferase (adenine-specific)
MDLRQGDCLCQINGLSTIDDKSIDMVLCDLPYNMTANHWDKGLDLEALFKQYDRIVKEKGAIVLFGCQPFTTDLINACRKWFRYSLIWNKNHGTDFFMANKKPLRSHEDVLVFSKKGLPLYYPQMNKGKAYSRPGRSRFMPTTGKVMYDNACNNKETRYPLTVLNFKRETGHHTTQKPIALCEWLIKTYTNAGDIVLDNCMGSGTTGVACFNTERRFIGYEKDATYYEVACNRIFSVEEAEK